LRQRTGKATRIKEKIGGHKDSAKARPAAASAAAAAAT
jgi:hypothetical protein